MKNLHVQKVYTLSHMQEGMLFHAMLDETTDNYHSYTYFEQATYTLKGTIDTKMLEKSFNMIIERHDVLRTNFIYQNVHKPFQVVLKERIAKIHFEDISHLQEEQKEEYTEQFKKKDKEKGFDLSRNILVRLALIKADTESYKLIWSFHHIIMDGWCLGIITKELFEIYEGLKSNTLIKLKKAPAYKTYIDWLQKRNKERALNYWTQYLDGYENKAVIPTTKLNTEKYINQEVNFTIDTETTTKLTYIAKNNNTTLSTILQSIWGIVLTRYNNTNDVVFGTVMSGRPPEIDNISDTLGLFLNTVPIRVQCGESMPFTHLLLKMHENNIQTESYSYCSLAEIQSRTTLKNELINHIIIFENYPIQKMVKDSNNNIGFSLEDVEFFEQTNYDFNIIIVPSNEITIRLVFNSEVYQTQFIQSVGTHIQETIKKIIENPNINIENIEIVSEEEKNRILYQFNNTKVHYPKDKMIHELFENQVEKTPDNIAVVFEDKMLTYKQLNEKSNQLARVLRDKGVKTDSIVGIMVERSLEMIVGIMAVLKAGGAYLPIDPQYPTERVQYMLEDSGAGILLVDNANATENSNLIVINIEDENIYNTDTSNLDKATSSSLAYIIYTSGSTGKPKGVMIEHRNVNNFIKGMTEKIDFSSGKTIMCLTTISFDIFVLETLLPLSLGLKVVMANKNEQIDPDMLSTTILRNKVDILQATPTRMKMLLSGSKKMWLKDLKEIIVGGEPFPQALQQELNRQCNAKIYNVYGPTETTVWSTLKELTLDEQLTIGNPIANTSIYIVDKNNNIQPIGIQGELCIAGDGLARGYLNRPELTAEKFTVQKFVNNPFEANQKIYRTGDIACWLPSGEIQCMGRMDYQVKIRGFRIETGEIESQLLKINEIKEAVVTAKDISSEGKSLCAYIVSDEELTTTYIRECLTESLPEYMIPSYCIRLEKIPHTPNGKVDTKALPMPEHGINTGTAYIAPHSEIEKRLVKICEEVLEISNMGVNDNFFSLGGDSIKAIRLVAMFNDNRYTIAMKDILKYKTVSEIAKRIICHNTLEGNERASERVYNKNFIPPEMYPIYYPCDISVLIETIKHEYEVKLDRWILPAIYGLTLPCYWYANEDKIEYVSIKQAQVMTYALGLNDFLNNEGFKFYSKTIQFDTLEDIQQYINDHLSKGKLIVASVTTYFLSYTPDYLLNKEKLMGKIAKGFMKHTLIVVDITKSGYIVFDTSFDFFGEVPKDQFHKALASFKEIDDLNGHPLKEVDTPYIISEISVENLESYNAEKITYNILNKTIRDYLSTNETKLEYLLPGVGINANLTLYTGINGLRKFSNTLLEYKEKTEHSTKLSETVKKFFDAWNSNYLFFENFLRDYEKYHTIQDDIIENVTKWRKQFEQALEEFDKENCQEIISRAIDILEIMCNEQEEIFSKI